jgi:hypothetical protein
MSVLVTERYSQQVPNLPQSGQHILAHYDDETLVVYQSHPPEVAVYAADYQEFNGAPGFELPPTTWLQPSFLAMMQDSAWATATGREAVLAVWLDRAAFDAILKKAVPASFRPDLFNDESAWQQALSASSVRLHSHPDYNPAGEHVQRQTVQIGLCGKSGVHFAQGGWIVEIEDITALVREQRSNVHSAAFELPRQRVYPVDDPAIAARLGLSTTET